MANRSAPVSERIKQPAVFEDLGEDLLDCADATAWLARIHLFFPSPTVEVAL